MRLNNIWAVIWHVLNLCAEISLSGILKTKKVALLSFKDSPKIIICQNLKISWKFKLL